MSSLAISSHSTSSGSLPTLLLGAPATDRRPLFRRPFIRCLKVPDGLEWLDEAAADATGAVSSSSSSSGMVQELTMEADLRLARLELPELDVELTEDTVLIVEIGDMVEVRPLRELRPLSLLLWWW